MHLRWSWATRQGPAWALKPNARAGPSAALGEPGYVAGPEAETY